MEVTTTDVSRSSRRLFTNVAEPVAPRDAFGLEGTLVDGRYLVEKAVGAGGFGVVYRVQHLRLDSPVALKVLRIPRRVVQREHDEFIKQFLQEGKLLFRLGSVHPAIVRVLEAGVLTTGAGTLAPYFAMDWLDGLPLDRQLRRMRGGSRARPITLNETMSLLQPVIDALATVHALGVAHLDVKPGNIFLVQRGDHVSPRLVDFGLAKIVHSNAATPNWSHGSKLRAMTPAYAAPEQWIDQLGATGPWTDVHALALVCVELLFGGRVFQGLSRSQLLANCVDESRRPTPRALGIPVSPAAEKVFERALQVKPERRFADAGEFWQALCEAEQYATPSAPSIPWSRVPCFRQPRARVLSTVEQPASAESETLSVTERRTKIAAVEHGVRRSSAPRPRRFFARWLGILVTATVFCSLAFALRGRMGAWRSVSAPHSSESHAHAVQKPTPGAQIASGLPVASNVAQQQLAVAAPPRKPIKRRINSINAVQTAAPTAVAPVPTVPISNSVPDASSPVDHRAEPVFGQSPSAADLIHHESLRSRK